MRACVNANASATLKDALDDERMMSSTTMIP